MDDENSKTIKNKILTRLIFNYVFYENYYMIPWFLVLSIHYSIYNEDKTLKRSDFFFKSFFDNDFISYYSKLIEQMKEGDFDSKNSFSSGAFVFSFERINSLDQATMNSSS